MMAARVLLFGRLKDVFGGSWLAMPGGVHSAAELRERLAADYPDLADIIRSRAVRIAVNQEMAMDEEATTLTGGDEVALLPPLSGG